MTKLTPMLEQYFSFKERYPECILFFRMGDFYEMFYDDAIKASKVLGITLTTRDKGMPEAAPLCGVPYHSADPYLSKLVEAGFKVAICEQVEDPKKAKGIVRRAVTRVVTPGTAMSARGEERGPRYLAAVSAGDGRFGLAHVDYSTGEFRATEVGRLAELIDELERLDPSEIVVARTALDDPELGAALGESPGDDQRRSLTVAPERGFEPEQARRFLLEHFQTETLEAFGVAGFPEAARAAGGLLAYLADTQEPDEPPAFENTGNEPLCLPHPLSHITALSYYSAADYMALDESTKRNLELIRTLRDGRRRGSLLWLIDKTVSAMGGRALLHWLHYPLLGLDRIRARQDAVSEGVENDALRLDLRELLSHVTDLERLAARVSTGSAGPRDLAAVRQTLSGLPRIKAALSHAASELFCEVRDRLDLMDDLLKLLERALVDDPPLSPREGGIIRPGYSAEVDELAAIQKDAKSVMARMEADEKKKTGIGSLKVRYNKVFGYYMEVTKSNLHLVPDYFIRKQTLTNAERFITPELKDLEAKVLGAEERLYELHYQLFAELRDQTALRASGLVENAALLGRLDALLGLSELAAIKRFSRPVVDDSDVIDIRGGWHPVVEALVKSERFVPNDVRLDNEENQILLITGPNMAGKSTVLRQTAIIAILAQMGGFVPAESARVGVVDRIFTRVGASDVLVRGMSTFMVEMTEAANILHNATPQSLVLLDEIGRGTSTFDGLSIAWAVAEFLHETKGRQAKTMFATHYHELVDLAETLPRVKNFHILVREWEGDVIFLRKMAPGSTSRSYGIQVARLAGLPTPVIERATEILGNLEAIERDPAGSPAIGKSRKSTTKEGPQQLNFFARPADPVADDIMARLKGIDVHQLTPLEALAILDEFTRIIRKK